MSAESNLETVNRAHDAWNRGDLDGFLATIDPRIVWEPSGAFPGIDTRYEGHQGVRDFWTAFMEPWESLSIEFTEVREFGENAIVVRVLFRGRGRGGIEVERDFGQYYGIEDDLLIRMRSFASWEEALAAAGAGEADS